MVKRGRDEARWTEKGDSQGRSVQREENRVGGRKTEWREKQGIEQEQGYSCCRPDPTSHPPLPHSCLHLPKPSPFRATSSPSVPSALSPSPLVPLSPSPTMAQPPTYPAHRPTIPHSNTPTDRSIPTNYQAAPRLSFYPSTLNGPENRVDTPARMDPLFLFLFLSVPVSRASDRPPSSKARTRSRETPLNGNRDRSVQSLHRYRSPDWKPFSIVARLTRPRI